MPVIPALTFAGRPLSGRSRRAGGKLTITMAARQISPPATMLGVRRSPSAMATPTGSTVETSAATGATTLIGAAAKPA